MQPLGCADPGTEFLGPLPPVVGVAGHIIHYDLLQVKPHLRAKWP